MGAWGNKLFDDDTACDVRDEYVRLLGEGHAGAAATDLILDRWKDAVADSDDGPVFWLALAATQHKYGRLESRVMSRAMAVLDQGLGLDRWREIGAHAVRGRQRQLEKVRRQLLSPQPKEKRVPPPFKDTCIWQVGEVIGYRLKSERLALLNVLGTEAHAKGVSPVCELLDWHEGEPPSDATIESLGVCRGVLPPETLLSALAATYSENDIDPTGTRQRMLAEMGLIPQRRDTTDFDPSLLVTVAETIHRLRSGHPEVTEKVKEFARQRKPILLEPVTQFSLRRELKKSEMPAKRVVRLGIRRSHASPLGEWLVVRWYELDEALHDLFGLEGRRP
jgi:hypothetical protein